MRVILACALFALAVAPQRPPAAAPAGSGGGVQGRGGGIPRPPARPMNARTRSATADAIDRYLAGDYERSLTTLGSLGGFDPTNAEEWILSGGPGAVQTRRLIAAVVALEYTASRPGLSPMLFEWGARTLRESVDPQASEALWLRASIALAEGRGAWPLLMGVSPGAGARPGLPAVPADPLAGAGHLAYARSRFADDPYFKLVQVVAVEAATSPAAGAIVLTPDGTGVVTDQFDAQMLHPSATGPPNGLALLERAAGAADALVEDPLVGPEARLRLGYLRLRLGHDELALQQFRRIHTDDPFVSYLGQLFSGWTLAKDGQTDAAISAYRAALAVVPHARSASTLLTAFCLMNGRPDDAEALANELMRKPAVGEDPWRGYLLGDYRAYPVLVARLREAIR